MISCHHIVYIVRNTILLMVNDMPEVVLRVEVPPGLEQEFKIALERLTTEFIDELKLSVARNILSKSELTEELAKKFADEVKEGMAKRHGLI